MNNFKRTTPARESFVSVRKTARAKATKSKLWNWQALLQRGVLALFLAVTTTACWQDLPTPLKPIKPSEPKPAWGPDIDPQMQAVIEQLNSFNSPPLVELSADQAREAPLPADAVKALLEKNGIPPTPPAVDVSHKVIPGPSPEDILVRIYTPKKGSGPFPVIVYYHGGGWVIANLDTYDASARALAKKSEAIVVSVAYRQAPEHMYPAAHEDAFAAYQWVVENAAEINGDSDRIATAGESAGGNLAVAVPIMAKERDVKLPVHILSVYPIADGDVESPTYDKYANAVPLNRPLMKWFFDKYVPNWQDETYPLVSLLDADLSGLPSTTIINAELDPLQHEGGELADRMREAGISVVREVYPGVTHEFFGMAAVVDEAKKAQDLAAAELRKAFD